MAIPALDPITPVPKLIFGVVDGSTKFPVHVVVIAFDRKATDPADDITISSVVENVDSPVDADAIVIAGEATVPLESVCIGAVRIRDTLPSTTALPTDDSIILPSDLHAIPEDGFNEKDTVGAA